MRLSYESSQSAANLRVSVMRRGSRIQQELELRLGAIKSREEEPDSRQLELDRRATGLESKERKVRSNTAKSRRRRGIAQGGRG